MKNICIKFVHMQFIVPHQDVCMTTVGVRGVSQWYWGREGGGIEVEIEIWE